MILVVGVSVRAMLQSAVAAGIEVRGIDYFGDADGHSAALAEDYGRDCSLQNLLAAAADHECTALVYGSGPENTPALLEPWQARGLLCGNSPESLRRARDPWKLAAAAAEIGEKMPPFMSVTDAIRAEGTDWLLKPTFRGSGHGIRFWPNEEAARRRVAASLRDPARHIVERRIDGTPASMTFLANGRQAIVVGSSRQLLLDTDAATPFGYGGNIAPLAGAERWQARFDRLAAHLTARFELLGLNTVDLIVRDGELWLLELNPRWSASVELLEMLRGESLFPAHLAACQRRELILSPRPLAADRFAGKLIVCSERRLMAGEAVPYDWQDLYAQGFRDIPRPGAEIAEGGPFCTALAEAGSDALCEQALLAKASALRHQQDLNRRSGRR